MHDDLGHLGIERVTDLLRSRFYWPKMMFDVQEYIKNCGACITRKSPGQRAAPLHQITSSGPMDLVCIDFLTVEPDSKGMSNVLIITDHFTRYAQAFPSKNQKALSVAKILVEKYFIHYGLPARIHSDQGKKLNSCLVINKARSISEPFIEPLSCLKSMSDISFMTFMNKSCLRSHWLKSRMSAAMVSE